MKSYNVQNYIRYKQDLKQAYKRLPQKFDYRDYNRDELIILFMPLVENLARKFATSQLILLFVLQLVHLLFPQ